MQRKTRFAISESADQRISESAERAVSASRSRRGAAGMKREACMRTAFEAAFVFLGKALRQRVAVKKDVAMRAR